MSLSGSGRLYEIAQYPMARPGPRLQVKVPGESNVTEYIRCEHCRTGNMVLRATLRRPGKVICKYYECPHCYWVFVVEDGVIMPLEDSSGRDNRKHPKGPR